MVECDCTALTGVLLDLRRSLREEEAAFDDYLRRAAAVEAALQNMGTMHSLEKLAQVYEHIAQEEKQHYQEFLDLYKELSAASKDCSCLAVNQMINFSESVILRTLCPV